MKFKHISTIDLKLGDGCVIETISLDNIIYKYKISFYHHNKFIKYYIASKHSLKSFNYLKKNSILLKDDISDISDNNDNPMRILNLYGIQKIQ